MSTILTEAVVNIDLTPLGWMVIVGGIACFTMGFGIGANDVANNMGSAIGSGALTFRSAVVLAALFELAGAVLLGASVTDSIKSGIIKPSYAELRPDLVMWSNLSALITGTVWLIGASVLGLPVSTTHTIVGALFGAAIALPNGHEIVDWVYLGSVIASWFASPILCMLFTALIYSGYRHFILRKDVDQAIKLAKNSLWGTMFVTLSVFGIFFIMKTPVTKKWANSDGNMGAAIGAGFGIGAAGMIIVTPIFHKFAKRKMTHMNDEANDEVNQSELKISEEGNDGSSSHAHAEEDKLHDLFEERSSDEEIDCNEKLKKKWYSLPWFMDIKAVALSDDLHAVQAREKAEQFHPKTEQYFAYLQVITSSLSCIVHGANDVANATAPFSGIYGLYDANGFTDEVSTPYWILALGGASIGIGVFFLGHKVIMSMGFKLAVITPSRGFCMELGSTFVMVIGSFAGIPLSTTHCKVGGTMAIGLLEASDEPSRRNFNGKINPGALNGRLVIKIIVSWIATLVVAGAMSAAVFSLGIYSPSITL